MTNILLIDYSSILHQTWHAESANPDPNATSTNVVARVRALASGTPHVALCCEGKGSFRKALDPTYKAQRPTPIAELHHQGDVALDVLRADGFPVWRADGYEADDVIATAVYACSGDAYPITIASADKDLLQLVGPHVTVHSLTSGNDIDADGVQAKFGVAPHQMVDYLSLVGDTSDNIKGAKGIGAKGAAKMLTEFGNLDDLYAAMEEGEDKFTPSIHASLLEFKPRAALVRELITLKTDAPIPFEEIFRERQPSDDAVFDGTDAQIAADIEETMQSLVKPRLPEMFQSPSATADRVEPKTAADRVDVVAPEPVTPTPTPSARAEQNAEHGAASQAQLQVVPQTPDVLAPALRTVYQCIVAVSAEIAKTGLAKLRKNDAQGYKFRGIDDVLNLLSPIISKHGLAILPRMLKREVTERATAKGGMLFAVTVEAEFDFVSSHDGSTHIVRMFGEAMDSGDKATNKAMSAAYKYAAFQTFCIPTEGDNDADAFTHQEIIPKGYGDWLTELRTLVVPQGTEKLQAAWKASKMEYREYIKVAAPALWEQMKQSAAAVKPVQVTS